MSRSLVRLSTVIPMCAVLLAGGTAFTLAGTSQQASSSGTAGSLAIPDRYCYSWDFQNDTGQDANDLHVRLVGIHTVSSVYLGPENPFGAPDASSGYDAGTNSYALNFSSATVADGDTAQIGLCTDQPLLALGPGAPSFTWTLDGAPLSTQPLFAGLAWHWQGRDQLTVQLTGDAQVSMTLMSLNLLDAGDKLELDDLNGPVAAGLPMVGELVPDPVLMNPGAADTFDVHFGTTADSAAALLEPNHPYVLEAVLASVDDPGNTIHLYSQALSPLAAVYLPMVIKH